MPRPAALLRPLSLGLALVALFAAARADAQADPIQFTSGTITGCHACIDEIVNSVNVTGGGLVLHGSSESYRLLGPGFTARATFSPAGGTPRLTYEGVTYLVAFPGSQLNFSTGTHVLPGPAPANTESFVEIPFTMTGVLNASLTSPVGPTVLSFEVAGQGIARARYRSDGQFQILQDVVYTFQPAAAPEPATMILLATGLAGAAAGARQRRKA